MPLCELVAAVSEVARRRMLAQVKLEQQPVILEQNITDLVNIIQHRDATNYGKMQC